MSIATAVGAMRRAVTPKPADPGFALKSPASFYHAIKPLTGRLTQRQVDTVNGLLLACKRWPVSWVAYALATAWHEARLEPIKERGGFAYLSKYDTGRLARMLGNTPAADGDGIKYAGRGLVQLTGTANYRKAGEFLGLDLLANPDLALTPENAARILVWGMEGGTFTGKKLADYLDARGGIEGFRQARRIINGTDKANMIAEYAMTFRAALDSGDWA